MARRALLMGSQILGLEGIDADLDAMAEALAAWGFDVRTLRGDAATRDGILAGYDQLVADAQRDDAVVVYYSGHGGYTDAPSAAQGLAAAFHQFIMPTDFEAVTATSGEFRGIMNVELSHLQAQLTKKTDNVVTIIDCCHSARVSRGDLARPRGLQATEWTQTADAFAKKLRDEGRVADARLLEGNPNAVRLVACGQQQQAYEARGGAGGYFTQELAAALQAARGAPPITWRQLMQRVRDGVLTRMPSQRPELEGPGERKLFETGTAELTGVLPLGELSGKPILRGGRLMGVEVGDEYLVMRAGEIEAVEARALALAKVMYVEGGWAAVELEPKNGSFGIQPGAQAFPWRQYVRRGVVEVEGEGALAHALRGKIEASGRLALASKDGAAPVMARVLVGSSIVVRDSEGQRWIHDRAARPAALDVVVKDLGVMAKAEALRRMESGRGSEALDAALVVEWGRVANEQVEPLPTADGRVFEGDKVYVKITNPDGVGRPVYVSIFDIGLAGKVTLLSDSGSTGVEVPPGQHTGLGLHPYLGVVGLGPVTWPEAAPRDMERRESLLVIATREPHDLVALQGAGATRGKGARSGLESVMEWVEHGGTRDVAKAATAASFHYAVEHIHFLVEPVPKEPPA